MTSIIHGWDAFISFHLHVGGHILTAQTLRFKTLMMDRLRYDPRAGVALWRKMGMVSKSNTPQWFSTHPAGKSRIAEMERHMPSVMPLYAKAKGVQPTALPPYQTNVKDIAPIR